MSVTKKPRVDKDVEGEVHQSALERAVKEAERDVAEGHALEHDEAKEKQRREANGSA